MAPAWSPDGRFVLASFQGMFGLVAKGAGEFDEPLLGAASLAWSSDRALGAFVGPLSGFDLDVVVLDDLLPVCDLVDDLSRNQRGIRGADCLSEEQQPHRRCEAREPSRDELTVLFGDESHA